MIISIGVEPKPFRPMRPRRAQRPVEQERPKPLALKSWNQPEVDELDCRFADIVELAESTGFAIEAQHVDMCGIVGSVSSSAPGIRSRWSHCTGPPTAR
nr:hypothetical protein [Mesorhizobium sp.]